MMPSAAAPASAIAPLGPFRAPVGIVFFCDTVPSLCVRWLEKTAECGGLNFRPAMGNLADIYKTGDGVPQDYAEAAKWLRIGAEAGDASSQFDLAEMYRDGLGVPQDYLAAHMWFNIAAAASLWRYRAGEQRHGLATKMTNEQIAEAQRLAREWRPKCGEEAAQVCALIQNDR